ncbi:MAG: decaprenyl-phosphate phosphoribosyltransferase [Actinomycetota bacterium]|nr:decaprenyl-phosphate phosphoribosyltransferase [Actinomycetota bacterium]
MEMPAANPQPHTPPEPGTAPRLVDVEPHPPASGRGSAGGARAWVRAARVRQWPKNLLVFAAPVAAGALGRPGVLARVAVAFGVFCLLASGAYLINDVSDAAEDRRHPVKRHRPIASGAVPAGRAVAVAAAAILVGAAAAGAVGWGLLAVAGGYIALNVLYTSWLRGIAIADIAAIAAAFVLRATAGGIAADIPISRWLIIVVSFAAVFVAAGKRYADFLDPAARRCRPVLNQYNADFLRMVIGIACAVALGAYCLWAFGVARPGPVPWRELTIVPFTLALLRYGLIVTDGRGGAPEQVLFEDRFTQLAGTAWLIMFALGV